MNISNLKDSVFNSYLDGTRFDENMKLRYDFQTPLRNRLSILSELAASKRVLHIGCCDHIPLLERKILSRSWLHGELTKVAAHCVGIDIDEEAVKRARLISRLDNIVYGDITSDKEIPEILADTFDYVILAEVMEHVGDPVYFLKSLLRNYRKNVEKIIITVPNAFRGGNILNTFRTAETINSDHRFFFTPYTLAKVSWDAGFTLVSIQMAHYSVAGFVKRAILNKFPLLAENLVYIGIPRS
jgi:2-polyprenyl-3-methyl-5-hydroxy-6-metoxy-1,4-benzoquinol methylase